jgi:ABC-type multidrug transport system fused ATPase/permease subunit
MKQWYAYLKQGLSRNMPLDSISEHPDRGNLKANLKNLAPYYKRHWRHGIFGCLLIFATALCSFPPPLIIRYLVDDVILGRQIGLLTGAILLLVFFLVAEKIARLLEEYYFARFEQKITFDIQQDLIERVLRYPKSFFDEKQTGYLHARITDDVDGIRWFFSNTIVHLFSNALRFVGGVVFLFYLEWRLAFAVLILLPGLVWLIRYFSGRIHVLSHQAMEHKAGLAGDVQESLSETSLIKAYANEDSAKNHLMSSFKKVFQLNLEQRIINSIAGLSINSMSGMARIITLAAGAYMIIKGHWTIGSLLAFQAYLAYVFGPAQFLASSNLQFQKALAALERVAALFDIAPEESGEKERHVDRLKGDIELRNISFGYNGYEPVLKNISLHINAGERLALVGPSGIGKTTLLSLMLRFYNATTGEIYFDGKPASEYRNGSLRRRIGYASQKPRIISGTVFDNIRYGAPDADRELVIHVAKIVSIHNDIEKLPHQYDTLIGPKGFNLSDGQMQRIAIARALIKDPDILILDEPTAALDSETEKSIFDALPAMVEGKTILVASHRLSTIRQSDRILLLDEKGKAEIGTHESLLKSSDYYRSMIKHQQ